MSAEDESCPRCHSVSWGQTPFGDIECTRCFYRPDELLQAERTSFADHTASAIEKILGA